MITKKLEGEVKPCSLEDYCSDMHPIGREAYRGLKDYTKCPLYMQEKNEVYNEAGLA
jgi:hypothetical protein